MNIAVDQECKQIDLFDASIYEDNWHGRLVKEEFEPQVKKTELYVVHKNDVTKVISWKYIVAFYNFQYGKPYTITKPWIDYKDVLTLYTIQKLGEKSISFKDYKLGKLPHFIKRQRVYSNCFILGNRQTKQVFASNSWEGYKLCYQEQCKGFPSKDIFILKMGHISSGLWQKLTLVGAIAKRKIEA